MGMTVFAAVPGDNYCGTCGAALIVTSSGADHWQTTHQVKTNLVDSAGNPVYAVCTVSHICTPVAKVCPSGHGVKWSGICHDENHSICGSFQYYE
ncbi:MAG: hypothetical protein ACI4HQ_03730 [Acetatifactor sp.]